MSVLDHLPLVTIRDVSTSSGEWSGHCSFSDKIPTFPKGWIRVWVGSDSLVQVRIESIEASSGEATFSSNDDHAEALDGGATYKWLNGYWGDRAALALDRTRTWTRTKHEPSDTTTYWPDGTTTPHPGGWDHDHCEICWEKIGVGGQPFGFVDEDDEWICEACHADYVVPRSIEFVNLEQVFRLRDG